MSGFNCIQRPAILFPIPYVMITFPCSPQDLVGACTQSEPDGSKYGGSFTSSRLVFYTFSLLHRPRGRAPGLTLPLCLIPNPLNPPNPWCFTRVTNQQTFMLNLFLYEQQTSSRLVFYTFSLLHRPRGRAPGLTLPLCLIPNPLIHLIPGVSLE